VELYADAPLVDRLHNLIGALLAATIGHMGLYRHALSHLLDLAERGVRVKASSFDRLKVTLIPLLRKLYGANSLSLMFGTYHPSGGNRK
jgi:hypothetical protein